MKTLKHIYEGFYKNTSSGMHSAQLKEKFIQTHNIETIYHESSWKFVPLKPEDLICGDDGYCIDISKNRDLSFKTNEQEIPLQIINVDKVTSTSGFNKCIHINDSPNLKNLNFVPTGYYALYVSNCSENVGLDLSSISNPNKFATFEFKNVAYSNCKGVRNRSDYEVKYYEFIDFEYDKNAKKYIDKTNFKNIPKSFKMMKLRLTSDGSIDNLHLNNIPKHINTVTINNWPTIIGSNIEYGFKELDFNFHLFSAPKTPSDFEDWCIKVNLKGTIVRFRNSSRYRCKGVFDKMKSILNRVAKKHNKPELLELIKIGE